MRSRLQRVFTRAFRLGGLTVLVAGMLATGGGSRAFATTGDPGWSCSVPDGYTYDQILSIPCGGSANEYHVIVPVDGAWACTVPNGFTHDQVSSNSACAVNGLAFHLKIPTDNLWACTVPPGLTWDIRQSNGACAGVNPVAFHLKVPDTGVWACTMPPGFGFDVTQPNNSACGGGTAFHLVFQSYGTPLINPGGIVSFQNGNYSSIVSPGDIMVIFGRQLSCGTGSAIVVKQGFNTYNLPLPGDPVFYQGPGEYGQINVTLPTTLAHQSWATVTVYNCNDFLVPVGGPPPSGAYWLFLS